MLRLYNYIYRMDVYNAYLHGVEKLLDNKSTTSNFELNKIGKSLFGGKFVGTFASDQLPTLSKFKPYCIANLDKSNESGSHWIAIVRDNADVLVYDSFGRKSKTIIPSVLRHYKVVKDTESDAEQDTKETNCGQRCISALLVYDIHGREAFLSL